jgi:hypothetical protein
MENYEKLKAEIQKANPEIMEWKFGCRFLDRESGKILTVLGTSKVGGTVAYIDDEADTWHDDWTLTDDEILGRPIRFTDVLLAIGHCLPKNNKKSKDVFGEEINEDNAQFERYALRLIRLWNPKDDNLDHQSDETKLFLIDLLT